VKKNENVDSKSRSRGRHHVSTCRRKSLVELAFLLSHSFKEILGDLKWTFVLGALMANMMGILGAIGLGISLPLPVLSMAGSFLMYLAFIESPIIYYIWRKIQHENDIARIMSEAWEGTKTTAELVDEYKKLLT